MLISTKILLDAAEIDIGQSSDESAREKRFAGLVLARDLLFIVGDDVLNELLECAQVLVDHWRNVSYGCGQLKQILSIRSTRSLCTSDLFGHASQRFVTSPKRIVRVSRVGVARFLSLFGIIWIEGRVDDRVAILLANIEHMTNAGLVFVRHFIGRTVDTILNERADNLSTRRTC